jgi:hypothetical protein
MIWLNNTLTEKIQRKMKHFKAEDKLYRQKYKIYKSGSWVKAKNLKIEVHMTKIED